MSALPDPEVIYVSPLGRRCRFVPATRENEQRLYFRYVDDAEQFGEGFTLTWANFRLMRPSPRQRWEPPHAPTR